MKEYQVELEVRSYEVDSFGHVNNAVYLNYLEYARGVFLQQEGLSFYDFERWKAWPVLAKLNIEYHKPARIHDRLVIRGKVTSFRKTSFEMTFVTANLLTNETITTCNVTLVFVGQDGKPVTIPDEFRRRFLRRD